MTGAQSMERHEVARVCMALPGVALAGTGTPSLRRTASIRSRMTKTFWPAMGLVPDGNVAVTMTRMAARAGDGEGAAAAGTGGVFDTGAGAGGTDDAGGGVAGVLEATEVEEVADAGVRVETSHCSECVTKVTFSPFIPETRRPLMVVEPEPRRE